MDRRVRSAHRADGRPRAGGGRWVGAVLLGMATGLVGACGASSTFGPMAPAPMGGTDLPDRFEPLTEAQRIQPGDTLAGGGCLSPMVDPRTDDRYLLVRSDMGQGDYRVPDGRYGADADQLLRLDCNTGEPLGLVPR